MGFELATAMIFAALLTAEKPPARDNAQWQAMQKRLAQERVRNKYIERAEASILAGLQDLEKAAAEKEEESIRLFDDLQKLEARIAGLDERAAAADQLIESQREYMIKRAAAMHRLQRTSLGDLFTSETSPMAAEKMRDRLRLVLAFDQDLMRALKKAKVDAERSRVEADDARAELEPRREKIRQEADALEVMRIERAALFEAVRKERSARERMAQEIAAAQDKLEAQVDVIHHATTPVKRNAGGFDKQKSKLPWPATGRVEVIFGKKIDVASGVVMIQKGIDLRAAKGEAVRAVFEGEVVYATWFEGYGRLLIIQHDSGFHTLYGHLDSLSVKKGDRVTQGQLIANVGDSSSTKGAYLYFELRKGKDPLDPLSWLTK